MNRKSQYKDLEKWRETKKRYKRRYYSKTQNAGNKNRRWTREDERLALNHEISDHELSELIGRSVNAIQQKRNELQSSERKKDEK